jgi:hypothetical protein
MRIALIHALKHAVAPAVMAATGLPVLTTPDSAVGKLRRLLLR